MAMFLEVAKSMSLGPFSFVAPVGAKSSNYRSVFHLLANLSVKVADDDSDVMV